MTKTKTKMKTRKSVIKRFTVTKNGKVMRGRSFTGHLNSKKSAKRKTNLRKNVATKQSFAKRIRKALGK